jgi:hypothetical protein
MFSSLIAALSEALIAFPVVGTIPGLFCAQIANLLAAFGL